MGSAARPFVGGQPVQVWDGLAWRRGTVLRRPLRESLGWRRGCGQSLFPVELEGGSIVYVGARDLRPAEALEVPARREPRPWRGEPLPWEPS